MARDPVHDLSLLVPVEAEGHFTLHCDDSIMLMGLP